MSQHLMIVPSLACPASCKYCFGPHKGGQSIQRDTLEAIVNWQKNAFGDNELLEITFHGGEPLVPGLEFYRMALPLLREGLAPRRVRFSMQSNLWLLTKELCDLFRQYGVSIGTSLDGPEHITDAQRGTGYFRQTMEKIDLARRHGLSIGCICTFTKQSQPHISEIFDFFIHEGLNFTLHEAVPSLRYPDANIWSLSPEQHEDLLCEMLDVYLANLDKIRISTLDSLCRSVSAGRGGICTFGDCLGGYLSVDPEGNIYLCQRFAGMPEYRLENVHDCPTVETLSGSPLWQAFHDRQKRIKEACGGCVYLDFCRGGCPYNAMTAGNFTLSKNKFPRVQPLASPGKPNDHMPLRDPHCPAYQRIFKKITDQAMEEIFSEENMVEVVNQNNPENGLLQHGKLISLMKKDAPHPYETAQHARRILAAVILAETNSSGEAARKFQELGLTTNASRTERAMQPIYHRLNASVQGVNNLYLHVTFACPLQCTHCYAQAGGSSARNGTFPVDDVIRTCREAAELGFHHAVITGGEPLIHQQRDKLLDALVGIREDVKPLLTVLRTSLALQIDDDLLCRIGKSTDEVVVSVDGNRDTHDARRGAGNYDLVVGNLHKLVNMGYTTDLSLATVLPLKMVNGPAGDAVRELAKELNIRRTRFRPILPLGRAKKFEPDIVPENLWEHVRPDDMIAYGFNPMHSCGMGQNLYVEPDGRAYPCYAWHGEQWLLGSISNGGRTGDIIASSMFQDLKQHTVNTNRQCRNCPVRYLCGGACRAWNVQTEQEQNDLDAPPVDCSPLYQRAHSLLVSALEYLGVSGEQWHAIGLSLPEFPSKEN